jgi:hypothetical protein
VPRPDGVAALERVRDEVDPLRRVLSLKTISPAARRVNAAIVARARSYASGRLLGELVRAAVHGGVVPLVELALGVEHLHGLLRRGAAVEVDQPAARRAPCATGSGSRP